MKKAQIIRILNEVSICALNFPGVVFWDKVPVCEDDKFRRLLGDIPKDYKPPTPLCNRW